MGVLYVITPENKRHYTEELNAYFRIRKSILIDQKGWNLKSENGLETDQFDHDQAHYLLLVSKDQGQIYGGVRLIPTTAPNLTMDIFPHLIAVDKGFSGCDRIWESSRFVIDTSALKLEKGFIKEATITLFIGMIEYGLHNNLQSILTMTEIRLERILRMCQWPLQRLGEVEKVGNTFAVAGLLEIKKMISQGLQDTIGIQGKIFGHEVARYPRNIRVGCLMDHPPQLYTYNPKPTQGVNLKPLLLNWQ